MRASSLLLVALFAAVFSPACFNSACWDPDPDCERFGGHFDDACQCVGMNYGYPSGYPSGSYTSTAPDAQVADARAHDASDASDAATPDASESADASVVDAAGE